MNSVIRQQHHLLRTLTARNPVLHPLLRHSSSSSSSPDLLSSPLIGPRAIIDSKRRVYEEKYKIALEKKAKSEGLESVAELKERLGRREAEERERKEKERVRAREEREREMQMLEGEKGQVQGGGREKKVEEDDGPVKPLSSILDLEKSSTLTGPQISALWTTYHQAKGFLSAVIPLSTYETMTRTAKKYPLFVLPLARDLLEEQVGDGAKEAVEMHLLEWAFLPPPSSSPSPSASTPLAPPTTVLFTPLGEYHARQSFSQPYLILTHYVDLSTSHKIILMRGEISDNVALDKGDAQRLVWGLQRFYNTLEGGEGEGEGKREGERERRALLECFHERPGEFQVDRLVKMAREV